MTSRIVASLAITILATMSVLGFFVFVTALNASGRHDQLIAIFLDAAVALAALDVALGLILVYRDRAGHALLIVPASFLVLMVGTSAICALAP